MSTTIPPFRTGIGYDIHRFTAKRPLILGGIHIPDCDGLDGHSDADCLTHALSDALLGSISLPDIGHFFPPGDPNYKDIDSQKILRFACEQIMEKGYQIANADIMIIAEKPKVLPYLNPMKEKLARTLKISIEQIGIKATTNETMGAIGRGEGIATLATVLIFR